MEKKTLDNLSKKAMRGMLSGALACTTFGMTAQAAAYMTYTSLDPASGALPSFTLQETHSEVHGCAGKNVCKGLGGCKVTADKLSSLAEKAGVSADKAGEAHDCAGLNACKGLGGCKVDAAAFAKMKAAQGTAQAASYSDVHACAGLNSCKGLGGCAVKADKLTELAAKAGVAADMAGEAHACAGLNACKGLGGCKVDAKAFDKLKAKAGK